jgi:P27 family predicted phage terminase small subunit
MARSGPIPGSQFGRKPGPARKERPATPQTRRRPERSAELVPLPAQTGAPAPPEHLGDLGRALWENVWLAFPPGVVDERLDAAIVLRYCEVTEEREQLARLVRKAGPLVTEPIVTPTGQVVGTRWLINPAVPALRAIDKALDNLGDRLAASPASRARLGLVISRARAVQRDVELDRLLSPRKKGTPR